MRSGHDLPVHALILAAAGALAGLVGAAGGITSLISYPALLAIGLPALSANIANNVALVALCPGSVLGSRIELRGRSGWLRRWLPICAVGGAAGAVLLLSTPSDVFADIVPFLVAGGSLTLLAQPYLTLWLSRHEGLSPDLALGAGLLLMCIYSGYFGAGAGVMVLTLVMIVAEPHLPTANALKNALLGATSVATALVLVAFTTVDWSSVIPLAVGVFAGSRLGPAVTRRVPPGLMRWLIALVGLGLAIDLWVTRT